VVGGGRGPRPGGGGGALHNLARLIRLAAVPQGGHRHNLIKLEACIWIMSTNQDKWLRCVESKISEEFQRLESLEDRSGYSAATQTQFPFEQNIQLNKYGRSAPTSARLLTSGNDTKDRGPGSQVPSREGIQLCCFKFVVPQQTLGKKWFVKVPAVLKLTSHCSWTS